MASLEVIEAELERQRRSIAMLPAGAPLTRETALQVLQRCIDALRTARAATGTAPPA